MFVGVPWGYTPPRNSGATMTRSDRWEHEERNLYRRFRDDEFVGFYVRLKRDGVVLKKSVGTAIRHARRERDRLVAQLDHDLEVASGAIRTVDLEAFLPELESAWRAMNLTENSIKRVGALRRAAAWFGGTPLCEYDRRLVRQWVDTLTAQEYAPSTVRGKLSFLSACFEVAIERGAASENPCRGVKTPVIVESERPYVSAAEIVDLVGLMPPLLREYVQIVAWTGLRRNEALYLTWTDVAPDFSMMWVRGKGRKIRRIPLAPTAQAAIATVRAQPVSDDGRLFPELTESKVNHQFKRTLVGTPFEGWTPHYLRHGFCSRLVRAGNDLAVIQRIMGHASLATTMRYASWAPKGADVLAIERLTEMPAHLDAPRLAR